MRPADAYVLLVPRPGSDAEKTILPQSGIVGQLVGEQWDVHYEGNKYDASNIKTWADKVFHAAARRRENYSTIARGRFPATSLLPVGIMQKDRTLTILDTHTLQRWVPGDVNQEIRYSDPSAQRVSNYAEPKVHAQPVGDCPDCGVDPGEVHRDGCDVERCSHCGEQRLGCDDPTHDKEFSAWNGHWPGTIECAVLGLWTRFDPQGRGDATKNYGYTRVPYGTADASPDLNALYTEDLHRVFFRKPVPGPRLRSTGP